MKKASDLKVQKFLEDLEVVHNDKFLILEAARNIVFKIHPEATERMMYGGIMFALSEDWGGLFVSKNHVSFEFGQGFLLEDPNKNLEGTGKFRRHLKLKSFQDIEGKDVLGFVVQILN